MAISNFENCLKFVLKFEGGFVNNPKDPGGPAHLGITQATLSSFLGRPASIGDLKKLTPKTAGPIYRQKFWEPIMGDELPDGIDLAVFDYGVHSGPRQGVLAFQRVLKVVADGEVGPRTIARAGKADPKQTIDALCAQRLDYLQKLKIFKAYGKGLTNRVQKCRAAALSMI